MLVAGTVAVLGSLLAGRLILPGHGFTAAHGYPPLSLADGPTLRAAAGSVLYLALVALLSLGLATVVRDPRPPSAIVLALLYLFPILAGVVSDPTWQRRLHQAGPSEAGLAIQATTGLHDLPHRARGPASACWPSGRPGRCWPAAWSCACATRDGACITRR